MLSEVPPKAKMPFVLNIQRTHKVFQCTGDESFFPLLSDKVKLHPTSLAAVESVSMDCVTGATVMCANER